MKSHLDWLREKARVLVAEAVARQCAACPARGEVDDLRNRIAGAEESERQAAAGHQVLRRRLDKAAELVQQMTTTGGGATVCVVCLLATPFHRPGCIVRRLWDVITPKGGV